MQIFSEQLGLTDVAADGNDVLFVLPACLNADVLGGAGAHAAVHGIVPTVLGAIGCADVFIAAGEKQSAHDAALRFAAVGVKGVAAVQAGLGEEGHAFAALVIADAAGVGDLLQAADAAQKFRLFHSIHSRFA